MIQVISLAILKPTQSLQHGINQLVLVITKSQVRFIQLTQSLSGLMSATDKQRLDVLHALEEDTSNSVVDSINEILAIFNNYPEGA